jgi:glycine dehydrogenase subunit 1
VRFISITDEQRETMLRAVGCADVSELFADIPQAVRFAGPLNLPAGMGEIELVAHLDKLAGKNVPASKLVSFAGAGVYDHHIPSIVDHILHRPEFFTAYTPYQPEVSQGTLQAIWEYQTMICELTGMDVANASMYDGATAMVEAALMACRLTRRHKVVVSAALHPEWLDVLATYAEAGVLEPVIADLADGRTDAEALRGELDDAAALVIASPNFLGSLEDLSAFAQMAHEAGALMVAAVNPILLGVVETPGSAGADIVVAEGQPLGNPMSFGGPGLGVFACREEHVRQLPGRLVGRTVDADDNDAYVLTLSTREQHIRREKATSNICSNHALNALAAGAYLSAVGGRGLAAIARSCMSKARYLRAELLTTEKFEEPWDAPFGYEFALRYKGDAEEFVRTMMPLGFLPGVVVGDDGLMLFAVTEKRTRAEIDAFVEEVCML